MNGVRKGRAPTSKEQGLSLLVSVHQEKAGREALPAEMGSGSVPGLSVPFDPTSHHFVQDQRSLAGSVFLLVLFSPPGRGHGYFQQSGPSRCGPFPSLWLWCPLQGSHSALHCQLQRQPFQERRQSSAVCACELVMSLAGTLEDVSSSDSCV